MTGIPRNRSRAGLTLVEILVVLAIGSVVGALAVSLLVQAQSSMQQQNSKADRVNAARFVLNDMARSLESAYPYPGAEGIRFTAVNGEGGQDSLTLVIPIRDEQRVLAFQEISYSVETDTSGFPRIRKQRRLLPDGTPAHAPLGVDINAALPIRAELELQYRPTARTGEWQDEWTGNGLPGEVKVVVRYVDERYPQQEAVLEHHIRPRTDSPAGGA